MHMYNNNRPGLAAFFLRTRFFFFNDLFTKRLPQRRCPLGQCAAVQLLARTPSLLRVRSHSGWAAPLSFADADGCGGHRRGGNGASHNAAHLFSKFACRGRSYVRGTPRCCRCDSSLLASNLLIIIASLFVLFSVVFGQGGGASLTAFARSLHNSRGGRHDRLCCVARTVTVPDVCADVFSCAAAPMRYASTITTTVLPYFFPGTAYEQVHRHRVHGWPLFFYRRNVPRLPCSS